MITEQDHSPPFILSNREQILHLIFGEWQPLLALLGKHFDGLSRIAWTKATPPRCIEDCAQHFNREVRGTWRFSPLQFRVFNRSTSSAVMFGPKCSAVSRRATEGTLLEPVRTGSEFRNLCRRFL